VKLIATKYLLVYLILDVIEGTKKQLHFLQRDLFVFGALKKKRKESNQIKINLNLKLFFYNLITDFFATSLKVLTYP
jgi:hypothetical protein